MSRLLCGKTKRLACYSHGRSNRALRCFWSSVTGKETSQELPTDDPCIAGGCYAKPCHWPDMAMKAKICLDDLGCFWRSVGKEERQLSRWGYAGLCWTQAAKSQCWSVRAWKNKACIDEEHIPARFLWNIDFKNHWIWNMIWSTHIWGRPTLRLVQIYTS